MACVGLLKHIVTARKKGHYGRANAPADMHILFKLGWTIFAPANVLLAGLVIGGALLWSRWRRAGRIVLTVVVAFAAVVAVLPVSIWMIRPLEDRFHQAQGLPATVTGIITLGGVMNQFITRARGQPALHRGAERLTEFVVLARRYPSARLIFSGGSASILRPEVKEAAAARMFFDSLGLDVTRVEFEDGARNTLENAVLTRRLADPKPGERWVLITSAMHMPRSVGVFRTIGWEVIPYPVDYTTEGTEGFRLDYDLAGGLSALSVAVREWGALFAYRLLGRTRSLFPAPAPTASHSGLPRAPAYGMHDPR